MITCLSFNSKHVSFGPFGTGRDSTASDQAFSSDQKARRCKLGCQLCWSIRLLLAAVAADSSACRRWRVGGPVQSLLRHHFPFLYKNNMVPLRVLTAYQIPLIVFLPSSAHFYSFGYFILGLCKACFGWVETYCFISGCSALMWMFQLRSRHEEDVVLEFRFAARLFAQSCGGPRSPGPG